MNPGPKTVSEMLAYWRGYNAPSGATSSRLEVCSPFDEAFQPVQEEQRYGECISYEQGYGSELY